MPESSVRAIAATALLIAFPGVSLSEPINLTLRDRQVIAKRLAAGTVPNKQRQSIVEQLFRDSGCEPATMPVSRSAANVVCTLSGSTNATIIVGAHYDFIDRGQGIVDDWSGTALLSSLYETLKSGTRQHSYKFIAFAAEERGLVGSARFVKELSVTEKANVLAFVNLECLGLSPTKVWASRADPVLLTRWAEIIKAMHMPLSGINVEKVGDDDSHAFLSQKIRVITIHSITQETLGILHSRKDSVQAVDLARYYDSYQAAAFYLRYLDEKLR